GGQWITRPTFAKKAIRAVSNFINDFSPDTLILGGDQLNAGPVSHWHHGRPLLSEDLRLKDEMDIFGTTILEPFAGVSRKVYMVGNHEKWIDDHVEANPGLRGLIEPEEYLNLK